jgi:hypothetical protein
LLLAKRTKIGKETSFGWRSQNFNGGDMQTKFDSRNDEFFHAVGLFFVKWSWLEDGLTYLIESVLNIDEEFGGLIHTQLSVDSKLTLITSVAERYQTKGLFDYERGAMKRLVAGVGKVKAVRNLLAHQPLTDLLGSVPQTEDLGEIAAMSIRIKRGGKADVPVITLREIKEASEQAIHFEALASQLAQGFCGVKERRVK